MVSSGAIMPARAPASIDMLQTVIRPAMSSARIASPAYSMTWPVPPAVPMRPMIASTMSLAEAARSPSVPSTRTSMFFAGFCNRVWVASTCSTSEVPMPKARAPSAPWVEVWQIAADDGHARQRGAKLGADDVHDALAHIEHRDVGHAELGDVPLQGLDLDAALLFLDAQAAVGGGDVMVRYRERRVRAAHRAARQPQPLERLRAGHLMHEMAVDVEHAGAIRQPLDDMAVPDLVEQSPRLAARHRR